MDDAYIHLTFSQNLIDGNGFSFNPNEPTYGVTAPLWTLLLFILGSIFELSPGLTKSLSIIFGFLTIPTIYYLCRQLNLQTKYSLSVAVLWSVNIWHIRWAASGMEATLAVLLLLLGFLANINRRWFTGLLFGLAFLARPEAAVLAVIMLLEQMYFRLWKKVAMYILTFVVVVLPWIVYALLEFGTLYPNPALIKAQSGSLVLSDFVMGLKRVILIIGGAHTVELILLIFGIGWLLRRKTNFQRILQPLYVILIIWAVFPALFYLTRGVFITSRYLLIGIPPLIIGTFMVIQSLDKFDIGAAITKSFNFLMIVMIAIQLSLTVKITIPHVRAFLPTITALKEFALELKETTPTGSSVAIGDVGVMGYYADRYVIDLEGLVSPQVIPFRVGRLLEQVIYDEEYWNFRKPDFIIDKAMESDRLSKHFGQRYRILSVKPIPGGLVDTSHEQWYYTLYKIN